ncbi:MAG: hypothetical protein AB1422_13925 [bacterium]
MIRKRKSFTNLFIFSINLIICRGISPVYSSSIKEEDLELKFSTLGHDKCLQGKPLSFEIYWVNNAGIRQFNRIQNEKSYGKEVKEKIIKVKIATPTWRWDDNLKIKVNKVTRTSGEVIRREEKLKDINWCRYYSKIHDYKEDKIELVGSGGDVRTRWVIPPDITAKLEPGEYEITGIYDSRSVSDKDIFHGLLIAKPVTFYIKKPVTKREKAIVLHEQANYYGDLEKAKKTLRIDPTYYQAHLTLAFSYWWGTGELEKAIEEFEIYLKEYLKDPTIPVAECGGKEYEEYRIKGFIKEIKEVLKKREEKK